LPLAAFAAPPSVTLELVTDPKLPIDAPQKWIQMLKDMGLSNVRIRGGDAGDKTEVKNIGTDDKPHYKVTGLIMAGNVRHLEDLLVEQATYMGITGQQLEQAKALQAKVKKLEAADEDSPAIGGLPVAYWLDLREYDTVADAKKQALPMLILQGERDYQVPLADFNLWKAGLGSAKGVTLKSYPSLNHLFVAGQGKSLPAEYAKPGHVAAEVIDDIAQFVK